MKRILLIFVATVLAALTFTPPAVGADVNGDDAADRYVGTGGLILPGSIDEQTRKGVARCGGCHWRLSVPCAAAPPAPGTLMPGQTPVSICTSVVRGCPGGQLLRTWFARPGGSWSDLGVACFGSGGPVTIAELGRGASAAFAADLPRLSLGAQPGTGVLAQIPVVFSSNQSADDFRASYRLLGQVVDVRAEPRWFWSFGDGGILDTASAGGMFPDMSVSHPYRRAGRFRVTVTTSWTGYFTLDGLGEFPVEETVRQEDASAVSVGEGRAVLAVR